MCCKSPFKTFHGKIGSPLQTAIYLLQPRLHASFLFWSKFTISGLNFRFCPHHDEFHLNFRSISRHMLKSLLLQPIIYFCSLDLQVQACIHEKPGFLLFSHRKLLLFGRVYICSYVYKCGLSFLDWILRRNTCTVNITMYASNSFRTQCPL